MDPMKFNDFLQRWDEIWSQVGKPTPLCIEDALIKIELDIAQYVKEQQTLKQLKQNVGIS